ncbi:dCTP deaminase [Candidatus Falkowbacteria bacterium]|jgi:dCTP deaminase|nr:dCTP deaminase [Candidatus Falkowbacteria bacterium]MBT5503561.1 dCTP deaminase [Candidatus Falkowbacteria bacterium]MBT6573598.1 dCTP deaminase [Candidatus Falkowbacteria bacterium]MBT7348406.1 dCTP deaminase [Candidatus Falkowbacteria bacterium]MBT7500640.1 dCTP deaminase [Candidatus Falkowbacteria bacterium]
MSTLTKKEILQRIQEGKITFAPELDEFQLSPNSIDLRVGWSFYIPHSWKMNSKGRVAVIADYLDYQNMEEYFKLIKLSPGQCFEILPKEFILISTLEKITLNCGDIAGTLMPRSSALRRGLQIETGMIDCRYSGQLTIPVVNNSHHIIKLYPGERICQVQLYKLESDLSKEDAKKHGKQDAKYAGSTPYSLESKADNTEEIEQIKQGNLIELKQKNNLKTLAETSQQLPKTNQGNTNAQQL